MVGGTLETRSIEECFFAAALTERQLVTSLREVDDNMATITHIFYIG